ncbi:MAG: hypothetical protein KME50_31070 [Nostoc desertorum CM1-VF14]|nr:hypothetical protein [Nostoc desertorum CM1-VF14]
MEFAVIRDLTHTGGLNLLFEQIVFLSQCRRTTLRVTLLLCETLRERRYR